MAQGLAATSPPILLLQTEREKEREEGEVFIFIYYIYLRIFYFSLTVVSFLMTSSGQEALLLLDVVFQSPMKSVSESYRM